MLNKCKCNNNFSVQNDESLHGHCTNESRVRKRNWEEMWFKTTAEDGERRGSSDVWWKTVPQMSGCNRKRSVADSGQTSTLIVQRRWWGRTYSRHLASMSAARRSWSRYNTVVVGFVFFCCRCHCYNWHNSTIQNKLPVVINKQWLKSLDFCF